MKGQRRIITFVGIVLAACVLAGWSSEDGRGRAPAVDPAAYPGMSNEEIGHLRWALKLADQDLLDFSGMEGLDQYGMTAYRYCIAFTAYFLALEQYHKIPAWPELIQPRMDRLIAKMIQKPVWEVWAEVSRGLPNLEPGFNRPYPEEHDPVATRNIMYSGHLTHMIGLYEALYRDFKWSKPGAIVFAWSEEEKYVYDNHSLNEHLHQLMLRKPHCIECEPNACFPECNQHPILGFLLHDQVHGTRLFPEASEAFLDFFLEKRMIHPNTHITAALYLIKQDITLSNEDPRFKNILDVVLTPLVSLGIISLDSASADGWTGAFMHIWQPEYIARHYPAQKERVLREHREDQARLTRTLWEPQLKYGFFAIYAAEMGDLETRDKLLRYADAKYDPVWKNGTFRYPYNLAKGCTNLTDKLLAFARANFAHGLRLMHTRVFDDAHFAEPKVAFVPFPQLLLRRAICDREKKALVITTLPGETSAGKASFKIVNLEPSRTYSLFLDGTEVKKISGPREMEVEVPLEGEHNVILSWE